MQAVCLDRYLMFVVHLADTLYELHGAGSGPSQSGPFILIVCLTGGPISIVHYNYLQLLTNFNTMTNMRLTEKNVCILCISRRV